MKPSIEPLGIFHPLVQRWFRDRFGSPTDIQVKAWAEIAADQHVLITAPTGSGKTLAAFLWALDRLLSRAWSPGHVRVLYVSPLKALNNDVQRNLLAPLAELRAVFEDSAEAMPPVRVLTRSGDTPSKERQRMLRYPPEILITTPESLNLLLSSRKGRPLLSTIECVILDEVHAVAATKRGTHLITAVDRLVSLSGEFQRIALSATVEPLDTMAHFVGGYTMERGEEGPEYRRRRVSIVRSEAQKTFDITVRVGYRPHSGVRDPDGTWHDIAAQCLAVIESNRSTLIFANSRRLCERICLFINENAGHMVAYAHHGSLSRETRAEVEQRLKRGDLAAIVATNSLELGIDIGSLDHVVLIQTPPSVASTIQRLGRAGHGVGEISHGTVFPTHGRDFIDAAVVTRGVLTRDIETLVPIQAPLDVLAQAIVSMTGVETWDIESLYEELRTSYPYHALTRAQFELVLDMLAGRYADSRLRTLEPLVILDRVDGTIRARDHALRLLYASGGTIPDRGYFTMRQADTKAKIGALDEEFVWERSLGDGFTLGAQSWQIVQITHNDVLVRPAKSKQSFVPFWRAEEAGRGFHLSQRVGEFLEKANARLTSRELRLELEQEHKLVPEAVDSVLDFLARQKAATSLDLPHRHHLIVEHFFNMRNEASSPQVVLHTLWGSPLNRPFALALSQAWEDRHGERLDVLWNADGVLLMTQTSTDAGALLALVTPDNLEALLRRKLETTGFFGARFRENAARALLLPRKSFQRRTPLWVNRLRSKQLFDSVLRYPDFPIMLETWRTCLQDEFDLVNLQRMLEEVATGSVKVSEITTSTPSPFAEGLLWQQTSQFMYEDDTPRTGKASNLTGELIKEIMFAADLRPRVSPELARSFEQKAQRLWRGYAPSAADELVDWVHERLFIPIEEWRTLLAVVEDETDTSSDELLVDVRHKIINLFVGKGGPRGVVALAGLNRLCRAFPPDGTWRIEDLDGYTVPVPYDADNEPGDASDALSEWVAEWLRYYGPIRVDKVTSVLPLPSDDLVRVLQELADTQTVIIGSLLADSDALEVCDTENFEVLLRMARAERRADLAPLPLEQLPLFLAHWQGLTRREQGTEGLQHALEPLLGYPFAADLLEAEILPARVEDYRPALLDDLLQESELVWFGCGDRRIALTFDAALDLMLEQEDDDAVARLFPDLRGRYTFEALLEHAEMPSAQLSEALWKAVWRGRVTNDTFAALRRAIEHKFKSSELPTRAATGRRTGYQRWKATRPFTGYWQALRATDSEPDPLERDENNKDRVRLLLDRYGVLFRELLQEELPAFRWAALFRTLRLMELSGEIVSGVFFEGVPGLQFASLQAVRFLQKPLPQDAAFWMVADDPASLCGIDVTGLKGMLPRRLATTHLVYEGAQLVLVSKRNGREIECQVEPDSPQLDAHLSVFRHMLTRTVRPISSISVEVINGEPAPASPYLAALERSFDVDQGNRVVTLWKKHGR